MLTALLLWLPLLNQDVLVVPDAARPRVPIAYLEDTSAIEDEHDIAELQVRIIDTLFERGIDVRSVVVLARHPGTGEWAPLPEHLPPIEPVPRRHNELLASVGGSPVVVAGTSPGQVTGFLTGKTIYVSQGHGLYWNDSLGRWATQRGNTHDIVEDFVGAETIDHYFIPLLMAAGAVVFGVREPDRQPLMVIVDDDQATLTGEWAAGPAGWAANMGTLLSGDTPFGMGGTRTTTASDAATATATATFMAPLPADGVYGVNVAWNQAPDRAADARVIVHHAGGEAVFHVDQRRHGSTWMFLGRFAFRQDAAKVVVTNESAFGGSTVSIDAVRFGGGEGMIERGDGSFPAKGPTTGRPRWESCSRYHAQVCGAPSTVYNSSKKGDNSDDVGTRSRYAAWQHEDGEDAVFVSWHSNAPSPARGTSTWVYGPNEPNGQYIFTGTAGSDALAAAVHDELITALKAEWDPDWKDRGINSAWFGELNPSHNPEMPATLVETAFHSTEADAILLAEPRFRLTLARAYYRGVVRYFAERDGFEPIYLPEPPMHLRVRGLALDTVEVAWEPSDEGEAATGYRVWTSPDGFGWSVAAAVGTETSVALDGLEPGAPIYVRVTATNGGGESFPSATLGALPSCSGPSERALVVQGFNRLDRFSLPLEDMSPWSLGTLMRFDQDVVNTFDYTVEHGDALLAAGVAFDAAEATAVEAGLVDLAPYRLVDWILGEESTVDETFNADEQSRVAAYLDAGGRLLATGAEVAWDLDHKGSAADQAFCTQYLKVAMAADDAETYSLSNGIAFTANYDVEFADVLTPQDGAEVLWTYGGAGGVAAVAWQGPDGGVVTAGFPLEAVEGADNRALLMTEAIDALGGVGDGIDTLSCVAPPPADDGPTADAGPTGGDVAPNPPPDASATPDGASATDADSSAGVDSGANKGPGASTRVHGFTNTTTESACQASPSGGGAPPLALGLLLAAALLGLRAARRHV